MTELKTPQETLEFITSTHRTEIENIVGYIARKLEDEFIGEPIFIWLDDCKFHRIQEHVAVRLKNKGWNISIVDESLDQREGDCVKIKVSPTI